MQCFMDFDSYCSLIIGFYPPVYFLQEIAGIWVGLRPGVDIRVYKVNTYFMFLCILHLFYVFMYEKKPFNIA